MPNSNKTMRRTMTTTVSLVALALALPALSTAAMAEEARPVVSNKKPTASSSTINLVNLLVEQGVLKPEQAEALVKQAEDEAYVARQAARDATAKADDATKTAAAAAAAASPPGARHVTYVPDIVKRQLREDIRQEVMAKAQAEGWASPGKYPEWASRVRFSGDLRGRWESIFIPADESGGMVYDFNAVNNGSPYDVSKISNPNRSMASYNTTEDRNRARLRARLAVDADLMEGFSAGLRLATGSDSSPVSTNQTLGGSGGNASKYAIWLDRAFAKFEPFKHPQFVGAAEPSTIAVMLGRFDNPFWAPSPLVWNNDLGFDGIAVQGRQTLGEGLSAFFNGGAFPIFNTALDFSSTQDVKFASEDKYLFGAQLGFKWNAAPDITTTFAAGLYEFSNVQGEISSPCDLETSVACDTDALRPSFAQKGNTYMYLRDIMPTTYTKGATENLYQYFGLASAYRPLELSGQIDFGQFDPFHVVLDGSFVWNTAFDRGRAERLAVNNRSPATAPAIGGFEGGDIGWLGRVTVGQRKLAQFGDWNAHVGYKYVESDATIDAFTDSDFGLGGTNIKGYFLGGNLALGQNVWASAKWTSATAIAGMPYAVDILQFDFNAKF